MNSHRAGRVRRPGHKYGLQLEELESRWCPSCSVTVAGDTLLIHGDKAANTVSIVDNGAAGIVVTCDGTTSPAATGIKHIEIETGKGNDVVTYSRSATGGNFTTDLDVKAELGKDSDSFTANFNGNDLTGTSQVLFEVEGGKDNDTMTVNAGTAAAPVDIAAGARLELNFEGGKDADTMTVAYQGELDGTLKLRGEGGKDGDTLAANLALNTGSTGTLDAEIKGGKDKDNLTLNVTGPGAATAAILAVLDGGKDTDTCTATSNVTVKNCP